MNYRTIALAVALIVACLPCIAVAQGFDPQARVDAIAPYLDDQAFAIGHIDLMRFDPAAAHKGVTAHFPLPAPGRVDALESATKELTTWLNAIRKAGARELYVVASLKDIPARPPFGVLRFAPGSDAEELSRIVRTDPSRYGKPDSEPDAPFETALIGGNLCLGHANTLLRLKELKATPMPDLAQAFKVAGDTTAQLVVVQSEDTRRVLKETLPALPGELSTYRGDDLATIKYAAIGVELPPQTALRVGIQSNDEASAKKLHDLAVDAFALGGKQINAEEMIPKYKEIVELLTPKQNGDRLSVMLTEENGGVPKLLAFLAPPVQKARQAAQRAQSMNNFKQLALAMHIHHDVSRAFPAAATTKDGKSLLSWRVQLLPYLEEKELYDQFHHDEPWDSEHNQKLIEKMPSVYAPPQQTLKPGYTTYLAPTGKTLMFDGDRKVKIAEVVDGTSNTILLLEADAEKAVPWTKPEDLAVDLDKPLAGLGGAWEAGFIVAMCDGSVRFVHKMIDPKLFRALLERNDGQAIKDF